MVEDLYGGADAEPLTVRQLLTSAEKYRIPIYQRNYAWEQEQIHQLVDDVLDAAEAPSASSASDSDYFLGNLVVFPPVRRADRFEVVDGQQRLTTLVILAARLRHSHLLDAELDEGVLDYESRRRATSTLGAIAGGDPSLVVAQVGDEAAADSGMLAAVSIIDQHVAPLAVRMKACGFADYLLDSVKVARVTLPLDTDVNRYFEVMNTRGEQLRQQDIVKARLMERLSGEEERSCFAWLWDACSDMESYLPMTLARGDTVARGRMFGESWGTALLLTFEELSAEHSRSTVERGATSEAPSLAAALVENARRAPEQRGDEEDNVRFRSVITFSTFLLHVLACGGQEDDERESLLDDKRLVERFRRELDAVGVEAARAWVQNFAVELVQCRLAFDNFVIKREYTAQTGTEGDWSLKRLERGETITDAGGIKVTPRYVASFPEPGPSVTVADASNDRVELLQAALRVTYTSPRTMHWITRSLRAVRIHGGAPPAHAVLEVLEGYARGKVAEGFTTGDSTGDLKRGFDIPRIVFTYLDYLLAVDSGNPKFAFTFRNSIEHFYPQQLDTEAGARVARVDERHRDLFGNLALVTVSGNSKFSNSPPHHKAGFEPIVRSSPKLQLMAETARDESSWDNEAIDAHHMTMLGRLRADLAKVHMNPAQSS